MELQSRNFKRQCFYIILLVKKYVIAVPLKYICCFVCAIGVSIGLFAQTVDDLFRDTDLEEERMGAFDYYCKESELGINKDLYEEEEK